MRESALSKMSSAMRPVFTQVVILDNPENPKALWDMFKEDFTKDFIRDSRRNKKA